MPKNSVIEENLFIGGLSTKGHSGNRSVINSPFDNQPIASVISADENDVRDAVAVASEAFRGNSPWRKLTSRNRCEVLLRLSALIRKHAGDLARLESMNVGKPLREARDEVQLAADCFQYYAGVTDKVGGQTIPAAVGGLNMTFREPIGVCVLIVPWNFPIAITSWKTAPALAMGNPVVVKPASQTPLTALRLANLALEAGIPPGVLNVVTGSGSVIGNALVRHPLVRKISFTGSIEVGSQIMKLAADDIKRVTLELGGKSANIIFTDADIPKAADSAVWSALGNAGQDCCSRSRLLIQKPVYRNFLSELTEKLKKIAVGDPLEEKTELGPLVTSSQRERVSEYVKLGKDEGAKLVCGGDRPDRKELAAGWFVNPALFTDVDPNMRIAQEEIFGPVITAIPFGTEDEAIEIANNSTYGLSGSVWTNDIGRALRVVRAVQTGVISVNSGHSVHLEAPFGGFKRSGMGRELGLAVLDHYTEWKSVYISTA